MKMLLRSGFFFELLSAGNAEEVALDEFIEIRWLTRNWALDNFSLRTYARGVGRFACYLTALV
jgi:hypothetical protein